jgi:hypothetical protein
MNDGYMYCKDVSDWAREGAAKYLEMLAEQGDEGKNG